MTHNPHLEDTKKKNATFFKELKFSTGTVFLRWFLLSPKSLVDFQVSVDISPTYCPDLDSEFCSVFSSVQSLSCVQVFVTPWAVAHQAPLSLGILQARILE